MSSSKLVFFYQDERDKVFEGDFIAGSPGVEVGTITLTPRGLAAEGVFAIQYLEANRKSLVDHDQTRIDSEADPERWLKFAAWYNYDTAWFGNADGTPKMPRTDFISLMHHANTRPAADLNKDQLIEFRTIQMTIAAIGEQVRELGVEIHNAIEYSRTRSLDFQADLQHQIDDLRVLRNSTEQEHSRLARRMLWLRGIRNKDLLAFIRGADGKTD
jgi:hypothetical protein